MSVLPNLLRSKPLHLAVHISNLAPRRFLPGRRVVGLSLLLLLATTGVANAQFLGGTVSDGPSELADKEEVARTVAEAYEATWRRRLADQRSEDLDAQDRARFAELAERRGRELQIEVEEQLQDLRGDGILETGEISRSLSPIWNRLDEDLDLAIAALRDGYPIPPFPEGFDQNSDYYKELLRYTFVVRNEWHHWLRFLVYILVAIILAWGAHRGARKIADRLEENELEWSAAVMRSISGPLYLSAILSGIYMGLSTLWIPGIAVVAIPRTLVLGLSLSIFWLAWQLCGPIATGLGWLFNRSYTANVDEHILAVIARVLRLIVLGLFVVIVVQRVFNSNLSGMVASLGVAGLVLALALRSPMRNLVASLTMFADKPFRIGDMVVYKGDWGRIEGVGVRSTKFRSLDGHKVIIPNQDLLDDSIVNISARPYIRRRFTLSLVYQTPPEKVREAIEILQDILANHEGEPEDWPPQVLFESYGEWDLKILIQYCYEPPDYWQAKAFDSEVNLQILERFNQAGIEFAFPTETQLFKGDVDEEDDPRFQEIDSHQHSQNKSVESSQGQGKERDQEHSGGENQDGKTTNPNSEDASFESNQENDNCDEADRSRDDFPKPKASDHPDQGEDDKPPEVR